MANSLAKGLVLSDLHLFGKYSNGWRYLETLRHEFARLDILALNGDTFDFQWGSPQDTVNNMQAAAQWLAQTLRDFPHCRIEYVLGNHDSQDAFRARLQTLAQHEPRFRVHERCLQLGSALFLHGDCANWRMTQAQFEWMRQRSRRESEFSRPSRAALILFGKLGFISIIHKLCFPRRRTVANIAHYLDSALPGWRNHIRDCYFGHTHLPFRDYSYQNIAFHNSGSAFQELGFLPLFFQTELANPGSANM
jgi:UDP-2,3-diacylglucosamine hydrolase